MSSPLGLDIKINTEEMSKGDCIPCRYTALTSGQPGYFSELGTSTAPEIPVTGTATPDGTAYFIMVDTGLLICDRVVQTNMSWNALNNNGFIEGKIVTLNNTEYLIRSLSGGCAYVDENGNMSLTDKSLGLAFPNTNEYDKYIRLSDLNGKILKEDDNVWHWSNLYNWCKDTPITSIGTNTNRVYRGKSTTENFLQIVSSTFNTTIGFRPVLEYLESGSKGSTLWF